MPRIHTMTGFRGPAWLDVIAAVGATARKLAQCIAITVKQPNPAREVRGACLCSLISACPPTARVQMIWTGRTV